MTRVLMLVGKLMPRRGECWHMKSGAVIIPGQCTAKCGRNPADHRHAAPAAVGADLPCFILMQQSRRNSEGRRNHRCFARCIWPRRSQGKPDDELSDVPWLLYSTGTRAIQRCNAAHAQRALWTARRRRNCAGSVRAMWSMRAALTRLWSVSFMTHHPVPGPKSGLEARFSENSIKPDTGVNFLSAVHRCTRC